MADNDITSANASLTITSVLGNCNVTKWSASDFLSADTVTITEVRQGIDGQVCAGYLPQVKTLTITLQPVSNGVSYLFNLKTTSDATKTPAAVVMVISVPSQGARFTCTGFLTSTPTMFGLGSTINELSFSFAMQDVIKTDL